MSSEYRNFLELSYEELEEMNLKAKDQRRKRVAIDKLQEERLKWLTDTKGVKAVTVLFSDLESFSLMSEELVVVCSPARENCWHIRIFSWSVSGRPSMSKSPLSG